MKYVNKQTNNMYINKQTIAKAGFNLNSIKNFINMKTTFKNIFHNLIHINLTIFCLQMSIQIGNVSKQGKNLYKKERTVQAGFNLNSIKNFTNVKMTIKTSPQYDIY